VTEPLCPGCAQPAGTGTLLDFAPTPPPVDDDRPAVSLETWQDFARRYRCPVCVNSEEPGP
jgi:hypothetical protein